MKTRLGRKQVRGVSILELMLAVVIGFVVVGAVLVTFIGSGRNNAVQNAYSQMNDEAQIALNILSRDLQLAGYAQPTGVADGKFVRTSLSGTAGVVVTPILGCDFRFSAPLTSENVVCPNSAPSAAVEKIPSIQIVYEADVNNTPPSSANKPTDCLGRGIDPPPGAAAVSYAIAKNRYYVATKNDDASNRRELYCASNAGTPQPIVENVESIKFWYGMGAAAVASPALPASAAVDNERRVTRYLLAADVAAIPDAWGRIVSVRVCVLMKSPEPVLTSEDSPIYRDCSGNLQTGAVPAPSPADPIDSRYLRRAYFTTVSLRNKADF